MKDVFAKAKVKLNETESTKLMHKLGSDPIFAKNYKDIMLKKNENKVALFLKKNGFRLK
ncbi:hypothetical protein [Paenibacillus sp. NPDC093718]|uniref:hypothetical protein n=1 Tax=Paenibacillus sp. NPDC093718 TaxID=3390601 RepID=UPI003CFF0B52